MFFLMPFAFQGLDNSFEQTLQPWQALALAGPVYYADMSLRRGWNTTIRRRYKWAKILIITKAELQPLCWDFKKNCSPY